MHHNFYLRLICVCFIIIVNNWNLRSGGLVALARTNATSSGIMTGNKSRFYGPNALCYYQDKILDDAPIGYWRLGETSGTTAYNLGSIGYPADGTYHPVVNLGENNLISVDDTDKSVRFDGASGYVHIPTHPQINDGTLYLAKTIELWFKANGPTLSGRQVLYEQGGISNGLNIYLEGDQLKVGMWRGSGGLGTGGWVAITVNPGVSYHVAMIYDGDTKMVTGYLNGISFGSANTDWSYLARHVGEIGIGAVRDETRWSNMEATGSAETGYYFNGTIDEVALYNTVLSQAQIQAHAQGCSQSCQYRSTVALNNPIAYWRLGEPSGTEAINMGSLGTTVEGTYQSTPLSYGVTLGVGSLVPGDLNTATSFDGANGFVSIPNSSYINYDGENHYRKTIELWFKANPIATESRHVLYEQGGIHKGLNIYLYKDLLDGYHLTVGAWDDGDGMWDAGEGGWVSTTISPNTSYYVAMTYDGSTKRVTGYLNAVSFGYADTNLSFITPHIGDIAIGRASNETRWSDSLGTLVSESGYNFNGVIDEVALYNDILSQLDITKRIGGCAPTAVSLSNFEVTSSIGEVRLSWETSMEIDAIGFNLFRSTNLDGERIRLNSHLIPSAAPGEIIGAAYAYEDKDVLAGQKFYYWLEFIDTGGSTVFGPQLAKASYGLFMPTILH